MRSFVALLFISLLATCSHAGSPITVPLTRIRRTGASLKEILEADHARLAFLQNRTITGSTTIPATNAYSEYMTSVGIGSPPTYYNLIVDTGSSNTFCGTGIPYNQTWTSIPTGQTVNVSYGSASFTGVEYLDQVTLAPNLTITNQSIGDALSSYGLDAFDGIIGLGPIGLTSGSLSPNNNATIPTIMNNLFSQGLIEKQVLGIYFSPPTNDTDKDGALTYGGTDPSLYHGDVTYVPVTGTYPSASYWGINVTSVVYGNFSPYYNNSIIRDSTAGVVDTGTSLIYLSNNFFYSYMDGIPGAKFDLTTGYVVVPETSVSLMKPLNFVIGGRTFSLDVSAQLLSEEETRAFGDVGTRYSVVNNMGSPSGRGMDFILGKKFIERFYAVFDTDKNRVGFAYTNHTVST